MEIKNFLSELPKTTHSRLKRIGRGLGSGLGKTAGRGSKGQKKRGSIPASFEGGQLKLIKRLPYRRGIGNRSLDTKVTLTLDSLKRLGPNASVTNEALVKAGILPKKHLYSKVKVVAGGKFVGKLTLEIAASEKVLKEISKG